MAKMTHQEFREAFPNATITAWVKYRYCGGSFPKGYTIKKGSELSIASTVTPGICFIYEINGVNMINVQPETYYCQGFKTIYDDRIKDNATADTYMEDKTIARRYVSYDRIYIRDNEITDVEQFKESVKNKTFVFKGEF